MVLVLLHHLLLIFPFRLHNSMAGNDVHQKSDYASYDTFSFAIPLVESDSDDFPTTSFRQQVPKISDSVVQSFRSNGFIVCPNVITRAAVDALNDRLEEVLRGIYDRGQKPDKIPRILKGNKPQIPSADCNSSNTNEKTRKRGTSIGPLGFSGNLQNVKVLQIINIHKADSLFRKLETNGSLAKIVAQLAGWDAGARLAQDQVWAKPPGAPSLVFHRDSPYFMFEPSDVVTVWIALDDMDPDVGPLEYVIGSHKWGDGRVGSAQQFFHSNVKSLLKSAAEREGLEVDELEIVSMAGLKAGGLSIHHGKIWHGSGKNSSTTRPRRGLGLHFVPANVRFTKDAANSSLWKSYVTNFDDPSSVELSREDFPLSY